MRVNTEVVLDETKGQFMTIQKRFLPPDDWQRPCRVTFTDSAQTAFGSLSVSQSRPEVQIEAVYGLRDKTDIETFSATGGSVAAEDTGTGTEFKCSTGTSVGAYGIIRSRRSTAYRAGQGMLLRWTARFSEPVALGLQRAGGINAENELSFGYQGTDFGIFKRANGGLEIQTLTVTAGASGSETATITLDGTAYTVSLTSGTAAHNAYEIANDSDFATGSAWIALQNGDTVTFLAQSVGNKTDWARNVTVSPQPNLWEIKQAQ